MTSISNEQIKALLERLTCLLAQRIGCEPLQAEPINGLDRVYRTNEAAELLGLNEQTVRKYCRNRVFGTQTVGRRWVIRQSEVERFLNGQRRISGKGIA
jgi:excisionase family DNA binding protein